VEAGDSIREIADGPIRIACFRRTCAAFMNVNSGSRPGHSAGYYRVTFQSEGQPAMMGFLAPREAAPCRKGNKRRLTLVPKALSVFPIAKHPAEELRFLLTLSV
jgi:hypothetical protein